MKFITVCSILLLLIVSTPAVAIDFQPYIKVGGMELVEKDLSEGHKSFGLLGINVIGELEKAELTGTLEGFVMTEAADEDPELLHNGLKAGAEYKYLLDDGISPYAGAYFERWERDANAKYPDSFTELNFAELTFGIAITKKYLYARLGGLYPVWSDEFDGELGFEANIGFIFGNFNVGYSYKRVSFSDIESNFSAAEIGYRF